MTLLNDVIGDLRLGDLALPGSHDAATEGCDLDSYLVDTRFLFELAEVVTPQVRVSRYTRLVKYSCLSLRETHPLLSVLTRCGRLALRTI